VRSERPRPDRGSRRDPSTGRDYLGEHVRKLERKVAAVKEGSAATRALLKVSAEASDVRGVFVTRLVEPAALTRPPPALFVTIGDFAALLETPSPPRARPLRARGPHSPIEANKPPVVVGRSQKANVAASRLLSKAVLAGSCDLKFRNLADDTSYGCFVWGCGCCG
jgi:hypothetical protein